MRGTSSALLAACLIAAPIAAQQPTEKKTLTLRETLLMPSYGGYQLSPDGRAVLFTRSDRKPDDWESTSHIWLHELATGRTYQLTNSTRGVLKKLGKTVEFLRYPREGHGITEPVHRLHLDAEQEKWFDRFVLKKVAAPISEVGH